MISFYHILRILYMIYWTLYKAFTFDMKDQESLNEMYIYNEKFKSDFKNDFQNYLI